MKVRLKGYISGTRNGVPWPEPGSELDLPDAEAVNLCANDLAVPVKDDKVENAKAPKADVEERKPAAKKAAIKAAPAKARKTAPSKAKKS